MRSLMLLASVSVLAASAGAQLKSQAADGQTIGGVSCDRSEGQRVHIHQHLVIFDHGKQVAIPSDVGRPNQPCLYWLHTHTPDGIIHIEAPVERSFTLGDFFKIWGQPLTRTIAATAKASEKEPLHVWVDGKRYSGDPFKIPLKAHTDIVIEAGPPFPKPPRFMDWNGM